MKKSSIIAIVLFLYWNNLFCQYDQKYWNYRERFRKYFTVIGSGQGESNILVIRNGKQDNVEAGSTEIRIGNQVMNLGDYIAMLAMEYKILSEAGQSVNQTAKELYYALYAFNRLDYVAETHFNLSPSLNGFFIRDDVYAGTDFVSNHPVLNNGLSIYSSSKAALACLSECMAEEFKEKKIAVNCLALGSAQTEMLSKAFPGYKAPLTAKQMAEFIAEFSINGQKYFNGKVLPVSVSTP